ncbi:MAG: hypothetical protein Q8L41_05135 [Anaerolineales bacterium]|nr:hypothetical protein [Anaerolineales bacterium]
MNTRIFQLISSGLALLILLSACAPAAPPTPTVDVVGTRAAELASIMLTQTVAAYSPTPPPTFTPEPTATIEPTPAEIKPPTIKNGPATCYLKPAAAGAFTSNITNTKVVELLAIGATPGWYKIRDPYFGSPCWVAENNLELDINMDLSTFPIE